MNGSIGSRWNMGSLMMQRVANRVREFEEQSNMLHVVTRGASSFLSVFFVI